jgi:hypothetical protein
MALVVHRRVRLRDDVISSRSAVRYSICVGHPAVLHLAIRRLDEAEIVDPGKGASEAINPMFGPSGVSIGQMRP